MFSSPLLWGLGLQLLNRVHNCLKFQKQGNEKESFCSKTGVQYSGYPEDDR